MNSISLREPQVIGAITAAGLCLGGVIAWAILRKRPSVEELERERCAQLLMTGRIIDGTILDTSEVARAEGDDLGAMQLIQYKYEIAGVAYECSQDVTHLKEWVNIRECRLSFPCSVRYDPRCPTNSIVVAENWSGLRDTASSVPVHPIARRPRAAAPIAQG
jgi:hypothetical protein